MQWFFVVWLQKLKHKAGVCDTYDVRPTVTFPQSTGPWPALISRPVEGRRLSWPMAGYIWRPYTCKKVTNLNTNRTRRWVTSLTWPTTLQQEQSTIDSVEYVIHMQACTLLDFLPALQVDWAKTDPWVWEWEISLYTFSQQPPSYTYHLNVSISWSTIK